MYGSKPCITINGPEFENNPDFKIIGNIFVDFFKGEVIDKINLAGIDHVISITSNGTNSIFFNHYFVKFKKSGTKVPNVELEEIGPFFEFEVRRNKFAAEDLRKKTLPPKQSTRKKVITNKLKEHISNVHIPKQNIEDIAKGITKRPKGLLKRKRDEDLDGNIGTKSEGDESETKQRPPKKRKLNNTNTNTQDEFQ